MCVCVLEITAMGDILEKEDVWRPKGFFSGLQLDTKIEILRAMYRTTKFDGLVASHQHRDDRKTKVLGLGEVNENGKKNRLELQ